LLIFTSSSASVVAASTMDSFISFMF